MRSLSRRLHNESPHPLQLVAAINRPNNISSVVVDQKHRIALLLLSHVLPMASKALRLAEHLKAHPLLCADPTDIFHSERCAAAKAREVYLMVGFSLFWIISFKIRPLVLQEYERIQKKNISQSSNHIIWPASIAIGVITALVVWTRLVRKTRAWWIYIVVHSHFGLTQ